MANLLTSLRLLLLVPAAWAFADPDIMASWALVLILATAIMTDYFDGIVARRRGTASARGQLFDHLTDFLFVTSCLAGLAYADAINPWLPALIVIAFGQYVLDSWFLYRQKSLRMSFIGRLNGVLYFVPLSITAGTRLIADFPRPAPAWLTSSLYLMIAVIAWVLFASTLLSIVDRALAPRRAS